MAMDEISFAKIESEVRHLMEDSTQIKTDIRAIKDTMPKEVFCDRCVARKIIYWMVGVWGLAIMGALVALVMRGPK